MEKHKKIIGPLLGAALFSAAIWAICHELSTYRMDAICASWQSLSVPDLMFSAVLTLASYTVLTGYDTLALNVTGRPLPYRNVAQASFIGYAFSNNIGLSMLSGASVRFRIYSGWGLSAADIARVFALCILSAWLGFFVLAGLTFTFFPIPVAGTGIPVFADTRGVGLILLAVVGLTFAVSAAGGGNIKIFGRKIKIPEPRILATQIALSVTDWSIAAGVLYVLLPKDTGIGFAAFTSIFLLAQVAGFSSQVPGGLGVFEAIILVMLSPKIPGDRIIVSLLAYRAVYYLIPLVLAAVLLGAREILIARK
ncbi:MAG: UPF0104 family protein [Deltaproteobacteria bacterium]|nr:UPF0104 family protein [Deltaproteobacteria bacterium]